MRTMRRAVIWVGGLALILSLATAGPARAEVINCVPGTWEVQDTPALSGRPILSSAYAASATEVWAVGTLATPNLPLALTFDGNSWSQTATPLPTGANGATLYGISGTSPTDVWAVGTFDATSNTFPLIEH